MCIEYISAVNTSHCKLSSKVGTCILRYIGLCEPGRTQNILQHLKNWRFSFILSNYYFCNEAYVSISRLGLASEASKSLIIAFIWTGVHLIMVKLKLYFKSWLNSNCTCNSCPKFLTKLQSSAFTASEKAYKWALFVRNKWSHICISMVYLSFIIMLMSWH